MSSNHERIRKLEELLKTNSKERVKHLERVKPLERVEPLWKDFVSKILIRSGGKMRPFSPYGYQLVVSKLIDKFSNVTIVKSRQLGTTQLVISKFLHRAALNPAYCGMAFLRRQPDAEAIARRTELLAEGAGIKLANKNANLLKFANGAELYFQNSSKEGARSYDSVLDLLFDEAAFCNNIEQIYGASSASSALAEDEVRKIIISTPSAKSGWYWDKLNQDNGSENIEEICKAVAAGELFSEIPGFYWFVDDNGTCKVIIHWRCHPVYGIRPDYLEYRKKQDNTSWEVILREYDLRFIDPAIEVFCSELVLDTEIDFCPPQGNKVCSIGIYLSDKWMTAIAIENGFVIDCICENSPSPNGAIAAVGLMASKYLVGQISLKKENGGEELAQRLRRKYKVRVNELTSNDLPNVITKLQLSIEENTIKIPKYRNIKSPPISKQLRDFRRQGNKFGAPEGKRDDCVWALAFALEASENQGKVLPFGTG